MAEKKSKSLWDAKIIRRALVDALVKLDPRTMMKNPVMFVVEVGSVVTTILLFGGKQSFAFNLQITLWLWFTVLFANFAEAMAEGRGKAQADTLRKARSETEARRLRTDGTIETVASAKLRSGDVVMVTSLRLRANPRRLFAKLEETDRRSPAVRACFPMSSKSALLRIQEKPSSTE